MYIFKNALKNITRNKGRNILIGIILVVIGIAATVTLSIRSSAEKLISSVENKYDITASISINRDNLMKNMKSGDSSSKTETKEKFSDIASLTTSEIKKYGDSDYVKSYYYTYSTSMDSSNIDQASSSDSKSSGSNGPGNMGGKTESSGDFTVTGYSSYEAMSEFVEGSYKIKSGKISSDFDSNTCVINYELAKVNDISVGDKITLTDPDDSDITYTLKVTGIYKETSSSTSSTSTSTGGGMNMFSNSANTIITNSTVLEKISKKSDNIKLQLTPTFVLKNKSVISKFKKEVKSKGLDSNYKVSTNLDQISSETESISNLSTFALTFLIITLVIGGIVLFIINLINVRERKYEIGVLRTIGMKKSHVISQFVIELLSVTIVSLIIGCTIGALISVPTANKLLENEISSSTKESQTINSNFGGNMQQGSSSSSSSKKTSMPSNGVSKISKVTSINAAVNSKIVLELFAIGILLTLISSLAAMISISRFSPLTILKERS